MENMLDTISNAAKDSYIQLEDVCILCNNSTMSQIDKLKKVEAKMQKILKKKNRPIAVYNGYAVTVRSGKFGLFAKMTVVKTKEDLVQERVSSVEKMPSDYTMSLKTFKPAKLPEDICWEDIEHIICAKK